MFITSPILIGDVIKERLPIGPKLLKVAHTVRYLCIAAKVAYDIRRLPEFEVCVRTQTCIGGIGGGAAVNSKWMVCSKRRSVFSHTQTVVHSGDEKSFCVHRPGQADTSWRHVRSRRQTR